MRILVHFRDSILAARGTPLRARHLAASLAARDDVEVTVLSQDPGEEVSRALGVGHVRLSGYGAAREELAGLVAERRPDVVYAQTHKGAFDLVAVPPPARRVADLHGDLALEKLEDAQRPLLRRLRGYLSVRWGELRRFGSLDGFTAVSTALVDRWSGPRRPGLLLLGGSGPAAFRLPPAPPGECLIVGYAGSFRSYHGVPDLITAVAQARAELPALRLLLVGDIDAVPGLRAEVEELLGEAVEIVGTRPPEDVPALLARCDVLVVPRRAGRAAANNYPSKLSEYLATGRPVVATAVGPTRAVIDHGRTGMLVAPGDPDALAGAFRDLADPRARERIGREGRTFAERNLTWGHIAERLASFLAKLPERHR